MIADFSHFVLGQLLIFLASFFSRLWENFKYINDRKAIAVVNIGLPLVFYDSKRSIVGPPFMEFISGVYLKQEVKVNAAREN